MSADGIQVMSAEQYHADPCEQPSLSNSVANILLNKSPLHAWLAHPKLNPDYKPDEDSRFDLGSAAHALLLEGNNAKIAVIDAADWRTKAAKEQRDQARANGLLPILAKYDFSLKAMVKAARETVDGSELAGIFEDGQPEQTVIWQDGPVMCRSRLDWLTADRKIILDYKTTDSAAPEHFIRQIARMGYDLQGAFYTNGVRATAGTDPVFVFLAQEIEPPYACSFVGLSAAYLELAQAKYQKALALWAECVAYGDWHGYPLRVCYAEPPAWAMNEMLNAEET